jgi:hypothetical protein
MAAKAANLWGGNAIYDEASLRRHRDGDVPKTLMDKRKRTRNILLTPAPSPRKEGKEETPLLSPSLFTGEGLEEGDNYAKSFSFLYKEILTLPSGRN